MSEDKRYQGMRYEVPCSVDPDDRLTFLAFEDAEGNVVLGVDIGHYEDGAYTSDGAVVVGPEHLNELHAAINAAMGAVATNGLRLIEEQAEEAAEKAAREKEAASREALKRMGFGWVLGDSEAP